MNPDPPFFSLSDGDRRRLKLTAAVIQIGGLFVASWIWIAQERAERMSSSAGDQDALSSETSRRYSYDLERMYGKTGVVADKWQRWFDEISHGKPLAILILVGSFLVSGALYRVATIRPPELESEQTDQDTTAPS